MVRKKMKDFKDRVALPQQQKKEINSVLTDPSLLN